MLVCLLVIGTLALFVAYVIIPGMTTVKENQTTLDDLELQLTEKQNALSSYEGIQGQLDEANAETVNLYGELYGNKTYDTGLLLSNMMAQHNLTPVNLEICDATLSTLVETEETTDENGNVTEATPAPYAKQREVTLVFTGLRSDADAFYNELSTFDLRYVLHGMTLTYNGDGATQYMAQLTLYEFDPLTEGEE